MILQSKDTISKYNPQDLKRYSVFIKLLLKGELLEAPKPSLDSIEVTPKHINAIVSSYHLKYFLQRKINQSRLPCFKLLVLIFFSNFKKSQEKACIEDKFSLKAFFLTKSINNLFLGLERIYLITLKSTFYELPKRKKNLKLQMKKKSGEKLKKFLLTFI